VVSGGVAITAPEMIPKGGFVQGATTAKPTGECPFAMYQILFATHAGKEQRISPQGKKGTLTLKYSSIALILLLNLVFFLFPFK